MEILGVDNCGNICQHGNIRGEVCFMNRLVDILKKQEGFSEKPYWDNKQWSIGYGTNLEMFPPEEQERYRAEGIAEDVAAAELTRRAMEAQEAVRRHLPDVYPKLNRARQVALESMVYNLGTQGFLGFTNTLRALRRGDFEGTALGMLDSKAARVDAPGRYQELAEMMRTGQYPSWYQKDIRKGVQEKVRRAMRMKKEKM